MIRAAAVDTWVEEDEMPYTCTVQGEEEAD